MVVDRTSLQVSGTSATVSQLVAMSTHPARPVHLLKDLLSRTKDTGAEHSAAADGQPATRHPHKNALVDGGLIARCCTSLYVGSSVEVAQPSQVDRASQALYHMMFAATVPMQIALYDKIAVSGGRNGQRPPLPRRAAQ